MSKVVITIVTLIVCAASACAQSKNTLLQRINEIKSQNDIYFWDQYTHPDADTAKVNATKRVLLDVNNNRGEMAPLSVEEVMPHVKYITIDRGNLKQFFVYIKKSDAIAIGGGSASLTVANTPVGGVPVNTPNVSPSAQRSFVPDAFVQRIMGTKYFLSVYKLLKSLQSQGQILQFGKLKDVEDYSSLDLILFDMQSQQILTMLSSVTASGNRTNVVTGEEDSLDNYPTNMTAVIWYIKK